MKFRSLAVLAASLVAFAGAAWGQTQPIPGAINANGQPANVQGSAIIIAPAGGGAGRGRVLSEDGAGLPVSCTSGCSSPVPFTPTNAASLAVSGTSSRVAFGGGSTAVLLNNSAVDMFYLPGNGSVVATTANFPLPAGRAITIAIGANTNIAAITATGSSSLLITSGTGGTPSIAGGGGTGGGGGGAVTIADGADVAEGAQADLAWTSGVGSQISLQKAIVNALRGSLVTIGNIASGSTDSGAPVKVGGIVTTAPTFTAGQRADLQLGTRGSLNVSICGANTIFCVPTATPAGASALANGLVVTSQNMIYNGTTADPQRSVLAGQNTTGAGITAAGVQAQYDDVSPTVPTEDQWANVRMTLLRELRVYDTNSNLAQGSATSGQAGNLNLCATLAAAPTNTTATSNALVCGTKGGLYTTAIDATGVPLDYTLSPIAIGVTSTNGSATVTTGGTFQTVLTSNVNRKFCSIQNPAAATESLFVYFGASGATTANSFSLPAGFSIGCHTGSGYVLTDVVQISAATTAHAFVVNSQ